MSERVTAWIEFGPWDEEKLASTEDGRVFLKLLEEFGFNEQEVVHESGIDTLQCDAYEAKYGTAAFVEDELVKCAQHLGLWCLQGDEGGGDWNWNREVFSPEKCMGKYTCGAEGYVLLSQELFDEFVSELDDAGVVTAIRQYFTEGSRTLGEWIRAEG
ncbi:MAG: hypothetical protein ACYCU8_06610 [Ferrimicrobium acidiphilum]